MKNTVLLSIDVFLNLKYCLNFALSYLSIRNPRCYCIRLKDDYEIFSTSPIFSNYYSDVTSREDRFDSTCSGMLDAILDKSEFLGNLEHELK